MKKCTFILLLLASLLGFGCPGPEEVPTYYVSQEMLRYCWFPDGSYWIYEEDSTLGLLDSAYVTNSMVSTEFVDGEEFYSETYSVDLLLRGKKFRQGSQAQKIAGSLTLSYLSEFYADSTIQFHNDLLFFDPDGRNQFRINPSIIITARQDSITLNGLTYYDIIQVMASPPQGDDFTIESIWAKDVGVIHRKFIDGTAWTLRRYSVKQ